MNFLILLGGTICAVAVAAQLGSILTTIVRLHKANANADGCVPADVAVSVLRPVCGVENFIEETLRSTFSLDHPRFEIVFCVADGNDPVIPIVQALIAGHPAVEARLLIGNTSVSGNPKLNNLVKGWHGSRYDWVLMCDSNVLMPRDHIERMLSVWRPGTGLVCSPPVGAAPANLWAELECAFLNTYQARWQCFADSIGLGFAQGKSMLWQRDLLDSAGGIEALANDVAEDAAATKIVRKRGLRVRLVTAPFGQPLGYRSLLDVWRRQVRWARLRRRTFTWFFVPEMLVGALPPLALAAAVAAVADWPVPGTVTSLAIVWYGAEAALAYAAGWQFSLRAVTSWIVRDVLLPVLWISAWTGDEFEWRGNAMTVASDPSPTR